MGFTVDGFNQAKNNMLSVFNKALADAEALSKAKTNGSGADSVTSHLLSETRQELSRRG
jgi:hypothetical protein